MIIYYAAIITLLVTGIFFGQRTKENKYLFLYCFFANLVLTVVASFRYAIGFDYFSYRTIYETVKGLSIPEIMSAYQTEFLFYFLCKLISLPGFSYTGFIIIISFFLHSTASWFILRFSKIPWLSVYLYIVLQFLAHNMNLIRQSISLSFFLLAYPYLKKRKVLPYLILMTIGGLFHNSLFFMIPLYYLLPMKHTLKTITVMVGSALCFYFFSDSILQFLTPLLFQKYSSYQTSIFGQPGSFAYVFLPGIYLLLIFLFQKKRYASCVDASIYINSAFYTFLITFFITKHFILERFSVYPFSLSILVIPEIISLIKNQETKESPLCHRRFSNYALTLFLVFGGVYFLFAANKGYHHVYPYYSLFARSVSKGIS